MVKNFFKEFIIFSVICALIVIVAGIVFYEKIPNTTNMPELKTYVRSQKAEDVLGEDIQEGLPETIIYEISEQDLNLLKKENVYDQGKSNPFGEYTNTGSSSNSNTNNITNDITDDIKNPQDDFSGGIVGQK